MSLWVNFAIISTRTGSRTHDPQFSGSEVYVSGERPGRIWCPEHDCQNISTLALSFS